MPAARFCAFGLSLPPKDSAHCQALTYNFVLLALSARKQEVNGTNRVKLKHLITRAKYTGTKLKVEEKYSYLQMDFSFHYSFTNTTSGPRSLKLGPTFRTEGVICWLRTLGFQLWLDSL